MRLPFGLGRRSSSGDGASSDGSGASGAAFDGASGASGLVGAGAGTDSGGSSPPAPRAWASLPAIQRTTGDMPLVAAPGRFVQRLPGSAGLPPIVQPLGHEVSPLATPGLVVARVRAVEAPSSGSVPAPVQRRAARGAQAAEVEAPAFETQEPAPAPAVVSAVPLASAPAPVEPPVRSMPTVSRQAISMPERPLTSAAIAARPAPVQRATPTAASSPAAPALPRPSGGMRRVPSPAPAALTATAAPVVSREVRDSHAASAAQASQPAAPVPSGPTRRGLGEPMQTAPISARPVASVLAGPVVSRSTTSGAMPIAASSLRPVAQRSANGEAGGMPALGSGLAGSAADGSRAAVLPELRLPHLPVQRSADAAGPAPVPASAAMAQAPIAAGPEIRPIAGANPIRPSIEIQRAASEDHGEQPPDDELPSPWWNPAGAAASDPAQSIATLPGLGGGAAAQMAAPVQRTAAGVGAATTIAAGPWRGGDGTRPAQAGRSAPIAPPVQRIAGSALRPSTLPQPVGAGGRHGASAGVSVVDSVAVATAPAAGRAIGGSPVVQTSPAGGAAPATPAPAFSSFGAPAVVQREEASAPAAPASSTMTAPSERDLDELAQALFGRIRGRLRSDLMYDREAKGLTFDNV